MTSEELEDRIRKAAADNRLGCEEAHALSNELNITPAEIGAICNSLKIRINKCRLGCF